MHRLLRTASLAGWPALASARGLWREARYTPRGRLAVLLALVATPGVIQLILEGGPLEPNDLNPSARLGALVVAQLSLAASFSVMAPVLLLKWFVIGRPVEPIHAHTAFLPDALLLRCVAIILGTAASLVAFFFLFYRRLVVLEMRPGVLGVGVHSGLAVLELFVLGVFLAVVVRLVLRGGKARDRARQIHRGSVIPFLITLPLFAWLPGSLHEHSPGLLSQIGAHPEARPFLLPMSVAIPTVLRGGSHVPLSVWSVWLVCLMGSLLLLGRWRRCAIRDLAEAVETESAERAPRLPKLVRHGPDFTRHLRLFARKDLLTYDNSPYGRWASFHLVLLSLAAAATIFTVGGALELWSRIGPPVFGEREILVTGIAVVAMMRTLNSIGIEGVQLELLKPVMGAGRLFGVKLFMNLGYVLLHMPVYALLVAVAADLSGVRSASLSSLLAWGLLGATLFSILGSVLGFLLPDPRRRSALLPGASRLAQLLFITISGAAVGAPAAANRLEMSGSSDARIVLLPAAILTALLVVSLLIAFAWRVRRGLSVELAT